MATDKASLEAAFWYAVKLFSEDNFTPANFISGLQNLLAPKVKMKRLDDPGYYDEEKVTKRGVGEVTDYFLYGNANSDKSIFTPDNTAPNQPEFQIVGSTGFISGTGTFTDPTGDRRIVYSFTLSSESGDWKAIFLWGKDKNDI
ncbi:MAG: hypothetical protein JOZ29_10045 [Deltaproteobacteria bacterium]|nr:hypothetical protein [Deltaproteobacteria bacterium]MBV8452600.1 hypothetical protein [Deltaproteobacteria bacterium]